VHSAELLARGREILDPALVPHGFRFESGTVGAGSGGPFARGAYVREHHCLEFSVRWALGEVIYRVRDTVITHEDLMRVVAGPRKAKYPAFSEDPLDGFRHLREDLERHGKVFLRTMDEDFEAVAERAAATPPRRGVARLFDVEAG
jgi:hypothetical protein